jgi:hypothetical protein
MINFVCLECPGVVACCLSKMTAGIMLVLCGPDEHGHMRAPKWMEEQTDGEPRQKAKQKEIIIA